MSAGRRGVIVIVIVIVLLCGGCTPGVDVSQWRLGDLRLTLPSHLPLEPVRQTVVLEAEVDVPERFRRGALLELPVVHSLPTLIADGVETVALDPSWAERWRALGGRRFLLPAEVLADGRVHLVMTFEHRWALSGWWDVAPRLVPIGAGHAPGTFLQAVSSFAFFTLLLLVFHVLNLLRVRYSTPGAWFTLEAATGALYPAFQLGLLQGAGATEPALMGFSLCVSAVASVHLVRAQLNRERPPAFWRWLLLIALVAYALVALNPFWLDRVGAPITVGLMLASMVEQIVTFARASGTPLRGVALIWPVANVVGLPDMVMWLGQGELLGGLHPGVAGIGIVVLAQSFVLSREHARSQVMTDELNLTLAARVHELEVRQAEIQSLNVELKHQLAERSRELERLAPRLATGQEPTLEAGQLVAERYRVVRRIALGATGEVLEVIREPDGTAFAMKVLQRNEPANTARLAREAHLIASLSHPHLVSIVDVGMAGDSLFMVMPLAVKSVRDEKPRYGDHSWALSMLRQVASGLEALHAAGVVHRDVKPGNVLVTPTGAYQLTDFGAAAPSRPEADELLTASVSVIGTPVYMAPEMFQGAHLVTAKSDVFGFGVMAYEVLSGQVPRVGGQAVGQALYRDPLAIPPTFLMLDGALQARLDATLSAEPKARPSMHELVELLG